MVGLPGMLPTSSNANGARIAGAKAANAARIITTIPIRADGDSWEPFPISYRSRRTRERRSASERRHSSIFLWSPDSRTSGTVCPR